MLRRLAILIIISLCPKLVAQTTFEIKGLIHDKENKPLTHTSVVLKDSISKTVISYTYSNQNGIYKLKTNKSGKFNLIFRSLGYEFKSVPVLLKPDQKTLNLDVLLNEKSTALDEIIIKAKKTIIVKKDTINFKTKYYSKGTEQTVEDLLKNIPGINISDDGTIKVGNQEIEKLLVDGDDLFDRGYKILSKNMPAYPIKEVEILKKYSNNRLLKDVEESDKIALNLKLDEKSKRIWFGNIETSVGNNNYYQLRGNLMNFGKKNKYYFLTNFNTLGYNATDDIENLVRPFRVNEPTSIGDNQKTNSILSLSADNLNFRESRTNFNNAKLVSLNAIFNPTKRLKIKTLGFFNSDNTFFFKKNIDNTNINQTNFTNTQDFELTNKNITSFGKLDITYDISDTKIFEAITKFNYGTFKDKSNLVFNSNPTIENLQYQNNFFDQKISYSNKFNDQKVFLLTGRFINDETPKDYAINKFFHENLFPNSSSVSNIKQHITNEMQFIGLDAHILDRKTNGHLLELQLGNEYRKDKLLTEFSLLENNSILEFPNNYQNKTNYRVNNLYLKSKYRLKTKNFDLFAKLNIHQLFNRLENNKNSSIENPFFVNPSIGFDWKINENNKITSSYSYNTKNSRVTDVFSDFVLTGFYSFLKGTNNFNQLTASNLIFNYQFGNWNNRFFANTYILYYKNHDFFSTNTTVQQNFTQSKKILIKDREFISINSKLDYYFKFISSNLKLDLSYTKSEFKNIVNNSNLRGVTSYGYNYGIEFRSGFSGFFNYHFGTKWSSTKIKTTIENSYTDNISFLDLSFVFNKKLDFQVQSERYYFGSLTKDNNYYFLDFNTNYKLIKNKLTIGIIGKNIFNTKKFKTLSISDIGTSTTEYRLLPRFVLLKLEYRF